MHHQELYEISKALACFIEEGKMLHYDRRFYFPISSIFTKAGKPKKLDVSNRIKAIDDGVSEFIGIDDKYIFSSSTKKFCHIETLSKRVEIDIWSIPIEYRK